MRMDRITPRAKLRVNGEVQENQRHMARLLRLFETGIAGDNRPSAVHTGNQAGVVLAIRRDGNGGAAVGDAEKWASGGLLLVSPRRVHQTNAGGILSLG